MKKTIPILFVCGAAAFGLRPGGRHGGNHLGGRPCCRDRDDGADLCPKTTPGGVDKAETVYAKADADGTVTETTVEAVLKAHDGATIEDVAALRDIINKEGDEAYTTGSDNALTWENSGNAITYEGQVRRRPAGDHPGDLLLKRRGNRPPLTWPGRAAGCASALTTPTTPARPSRWMGRSTRSAYRLRPSQR